MASKCKRIINRTSMSSLRSTIKSNFQTASIFPLPHTSTSSPVRRFFLSRICSELGCAQSLLPLHSAVATARMTSGLTSNSRSCRAFSQDEIDGT